MSFHLHMAAKREAEIRREHISGGSMSYSNDEALDLAWSSFVRGAQAAREMSARFVEQGGDAVTAQSIRLNWRGSWGGDPGVLQGDIPDFEDGL
jgi:hypothetical protein